MLKTQGGKYILKFFAERCRLQLQCYNLEVNILLIIILLGDRCLFLSIVISSNDCNIT